MFKTILEFIVTSIYENPNDGILGLEIRCLKETLENELKLDYNPIYEQILILINRHPNDFDLGNEIRRIRPIFYLILHAEEDSCGDSDD
jgi:hypothetical protein